jgi:hypothetical protein
MKSDPREIQTEGETFVKCPHHGSGIQSVREVRHKIFEREFPFHNIRCNQFEYCDVDVSRDPELLKLLDGQTPLSRHGLFSGIPEPDLKKAGMRTSDRCPYCSGAGGVSYVYAYLPGLILPKTLQRYKMDCGHDFAIIYNMS